MSSLSVTLTNDIGLSEDQFAAICERVFDEIVARTPVDTGRCADAWTITMDGNTCYIDNPTPYVSFLEDGHSQQAPNGMVAITLADVPELMPEIS